MKMSVRAALLGLAMLAVSATSAWAIDAAASNAPQAYARGRMVTRVYTYQPMTTNTTNGTVNPNRRFSYQPGTGAPTATYTVRRVYTGTAVDPWQRADFKARAGF